MLRGIENYDIQCTYNLEQAWRPWQFNMRARLVEDESEDIAQHRGKYKEAVIDMALLCLEYQKHRAAIAIVSNERDRTKIVLTPA